MDVKPVVETSTNTTIVRTEKPYSQTEILTNQTRETTYSQKVDVQKDTDWLPVSVKPLNFANLDFSSTGGDITFGTDGITLRGAHSVTDKDSPVQVALVGGVNFNPDANRQRSEAFLNVTGGVGAQTTIGETVVKTGYVPERTIPGSQIPFSDNGVVDLSQVTGPVEIKPSDPNTEGRRESGYTKNSGGYIVDYGDRMEYVPAWTGVGHEQETRTIEGAKKLILALVPEQQGQDIQLGQSYPVVRNEQGEYVVVQGDKPLQVIAADQHPENFEMTGSNTARVEDTLAGRQNASFTVTDPDTGSVVATFNGVPGVYRNSPGATPEATTDANDAAVALNPQTPAQTIPGQEQYREEQGGIRLKAVASLTTGFGDERTTTTTTTRIETTKTDSLHTDTQEKTTTGRDITETPVTETTTSSYNVNTPWTQTSYPDSNTTVRETGSSFETPRVTQTTSVPGPSSQLRTIDSVTLGEVHRSTQILNQEVSVNQSSTTETEYNLNVAPVQARLEGTVEAPLAPGVDLSLTGYAQTTVIGRGNGGVQFGGSAEVMINLGQRQVELVTVDGKPVYETVPAVDSRGNPVMVERNGQMVQAHHYARRTEDGTLVAVDSPEQATQLTRTKVDDGAPNLVIKVEADSQGQVSGSMGVRIKF